MIRVAPMDNHLESIVVLQRILEAVRPEQLSLRAGGGPAGEDRDPPLLTLTPTITATPPSPPLLFFFFWGLAFMQTYGALPLLPLFLLFHIDLPLILLFLLLPLRAP